MIVAITGSRSWADRSLLSAVLTDRFRVSPDTFEIHVGDAKGADTTALLWARTTGVQATVYTADWMKHGKAAGPLRNRAMLDEGKPDLLIAFRRGRSSKGTDGCVKEARARNIPVLTVEIPQ